MQPFKNLGTSEQDQFTYTHTTGWKPPTQPSRDDHHFLKKRSWNHAEAQPGALHAEAAPSSAPGVRTQPAMLLMEDIRLTTCDV